MRKIILSCLLATIAMPAVAADLPAKAPLRVASAAVYSWTGFYLGGHLGAGWSRNQFSETGDAECGFGPGCRSTDYGSHNGLGVLGGGQIGFNWQAAPWLVLGIEGEYSFANIKGDHLDSHSAADAETLFFYGHPIAAAWASYNDNVRFSSNVKNIATVAGRIGFVGGAEGKTLWFVKGGGAWAKTDYNIAGQASGVGCEHFLFLHACGAFNGTANLNGDKSRFGWLLGTGIEHALWGGWTAKVEYNYMNFGKKDVDFAGTVCVNGLCSDEATYKLKIDQQIHTVKIGINYRLWGGN